MEERLTFRYGTVLNIRFTSTSVAANNKLKPARRATAAGSDRRVMSDSIAPASVTSGNAMSANVMARAAKRREGNRDSRAIMAYHDTNSTERRTKQIPTSAGNYVRKPLTGFTV